MLWKQLNFKALGHHGLREPVSHIRAQYLLIQLLKRQEKMKLLMWQMEIKTGGCLATFLRVFFNTNMVQEGRIKGKHLPY